MKVIIFGVGKLADYVHFVLTNDSPYEVVAFCIEEEFMPEGRTVRELPIIDFEELPSIYPPDDYKIFIAVGNNSVRERIYHKVKDNGYSCITYISSKATIWMDLTCGDNVFIGEGTVIQPFVSIGSNCILFSAHIAHHCKIGDNVMLSGCFMGGDARVGDNSFLGLSSTVNQNLKIGKANIIGVGANIVNDTNDFEVYTNSSTVKRAISSQRIKNEYLH
ncbi:acetyltransferase [Arcticibacter sp.]|jgi:sugar O-acyltransferase (sialic acid O-acetyltransferase NeuD family)|uniref:acetyltransferase n=1 Tax=Arcticibacter sp. TaxID=1872630 RepID=UPI003891181C